MKLVVFGSPNSPYLRKTRIVAAEKSIPLEFEPHSPWKKDSLAPSYNPLGKIPVLILENGRTLYDSRVIVEYLDTLNATPRLIPRDDAERIEVKRWEALADGICDAAAAIFIELQHPAVQHRKPWLERQAAKVVLGTRAAAEDLGSRDWCVGDRYTLSDAALICALEYLEFRVPEALDWRAAHSNLARYADRVGKRPSAVQTAPPTRGALVQEGQTFDPGVGR